MATKKPQVYVFVNTWKDRHGDEGVNVKVFGNKKSADKYFADDLKHYLSEKDAISVDVFGKDPAKQMINTEALESFEAGEISTDDCSVKDFLAQAKKAGYAEVNVDGSGTYASWSVAKQTVR
jgi:hypothetical protein